MSTYHAPCVSRGVTGSVEVHKQHCRWQQAAAEHDDRCRAGLSGSNGHNIFGSDVDGARRAISRTCPRASLFAGGLADNGGPTQTIALRDAPDNPALGRADPADAPATDQRGVARPQPEGTDPDIGAFELGQTAEPVPR